MTGICDYIKDIYGKIISDYLGEASVITTVLKIGESRRVRRRCDYEKSTEMQFFGFDDGRRGQ